MFSNILNTFHIQQVPQLGDSTFTQFFTFVEFEFLYNINTLNEKQFFPQSSEFFLKMG